MLDVETHPATPERWAQLKRDGCVAFRYPWRAKGNMAAYIRDRDQMPALHQGDQALANMSYLLGASNWILAGNAAMNPWVHLETRSQNYRAVPVDTSIISEMTVLDWFEKKGHRFIDVDVALYDERDDGCLMTINLRAIYQLRGA